MTRKLIYKESYKTPGLQIKHGLTPVCRHQAEGFDVSSANVLQSGIIEIDGERFEFQDVRIFFRERQAMTSRSRE